MPQTWLVSGEDKANGSPLRVEIQAATAAAAEQRANQMGMLVETVTPAGQAPAQAATPVAVVEPAANREVIAAGVTDGVFRTFGFLVVGFFALIVFIFIFSGLMGKL